MMELDYDTKDKVDKELFDLGFTEIWSEIWHNASNHYIIEYHSYVIEIYKNENLKLGGVICPDGTVILNKLYSIEDMLKFARKVSRKERISKLCI